MLLHFSVSYFTSILTSNMLKTINRRVTVNEGSRNRNSVQNSPQVLRPRDMAAYGTNAGKGLNIFSGVWISTETQKSKHDLI